jgi:FtsP/CotA-like multicopper oxidase with cupredoxin domain
MHHPIHFHGNRFLVLSVNEIPNDNMVWKDTALLRTGDTMDILLETTNPGEWMAHCHIAEHMHSGMMIGYRVTPRVSSETP